MAGAILACFGGPWPAWVLLFAAVPVAAKERKLINLPIAFLFVTVTVIVALAVVIADSIGQGHGHDYEQGYG